MLQTRNTAETATAIGERIPIIGKMMRFYGKRDIRRNNLDLLRLVFSYAVVYAHCIVLSGKNAGILPLTYSVDTAVQGFFLISGYLIFSSYDRSGDPGAYFSKRVRRIYPAYAFVILAAAFGLYFVADNQANYFGLAWLKYVAANLTFMNFLAPNLPGVFAHNLVPAVNGALWTIKVEVAFYLAVPLLVLFMRRWGRLPVIIVLYLASYLYYVGFMTLAEKTGHGFYAELAKQLPGQMRYFFVGAAVYYYDHEIRKYLGILGVGAAIVCLFIDLDTFWFLKPLLLACVVFAIAFAPQVINVGRIGDLSYAAYLFHFPLVQLAVNARLFDYPPGLVIALIFVAVSLLAYVSWHLLEKPFLAKSSHYIQAEAGVVGTARH